MSNSISRTAEGVDVFVTEPWPRMVSIKFREQEFRLSVKEAEGLQYALGAALRDISDVE